MTNNKTASTQAAWNLAAQKYAADVEGDIAFLKSGGVNLSEREIRAVGDLRECNRAIHLLCSHGLDALSLLNLGAREVVGVDISAEMLELARQKSEALSAAATWVQSDVLNVPPELNGSADLILTGSGALPWVADLDGWARVVARLLRPGGKLVISEGHPLNWVWDVDADTHRVSPDARSYFDRSPRPNDDFPAAAVARYAPAESTPPPAWEYQWTLGEIVTGIAQAGLVVEVLEEHPDQFWPKFGDISDEELTLLPHTFLLVARSSAA